ncbi:MAG: potassium channel protein [Chlorobi bacterium]|nr:potassium channel protein [Chlorobiota bacterium]
MERLSSRSKIVIGLVLMLSIIIMGVAGYMIIEEDGFLNALYMTVITVSTVGFGEVHKLSDGGKIFTMFLIIFSFTTYAYALTTISTHFFEGQLHFFLTGYKSKTIKKMQNHVIVCGYGRNGRQVVKELLAQGQPCIVVDSNPQVISGESENNKAIFILGDSTQDETLEKANIKFAKSLITTLPMDADNLYVVLTARALNPDMNIISRGSSGSSEKKLRMAGVDSVVMPESVGGAHMADLVTRPDIIEFLEHVSVHGEDPTMLEEIVCPDLPDKVKSKTIYEIGIRRKTGANIIGYKTADGRYILNPSPDTKVNPGSKLFVLGTPEQIVYMKKILSEKG